MDSFLREPSVYEKDLYRQSAITPDDNEAAFHEVVGAAFRKENLLVSAAGSLRSLGVQDDPDYVAFRDDDLTGYDPSNFISSRSAQHTAMIKARLRREREDTQMIAESGWAGIGLSMAAGFLSPESLLPVSAVWRLGKGAGILSAAGRTAAAGTTGAVISEVGLHQTQLTRTGTESSFAIGGGAVLGGLFGGVLEGLSTGAQKALVGLDARAHGDMEEAMGLTPRDAKSAGAAVEGQPQKYASLYGEESIGEEVISRAAARGDDYNQEKLMQEMLDAGGGDAVRDLGMAGRAVLRAAMSPFARMSLSEIPAVRKVAQRIFKTPVAFKGDGASAVSPVESQVQNLVLRGHYNRHVMRQTWKKARDAGETDLKDYGEWKGALRHAMSYPSEAADSSVREASRHLRQTIDELEADLRETGWLPPSSKQTMSMPDGQEGPGIPFAEAYFPRKFDVAALNHDPQVRQNFHDALQGRFVETGKFSASEASDEAEKTIQRILSDPTGGLGLPPTGEGVSYVRDRNFPFTDRDLLDLKVLDMDIENSLDSILARMGSRAIVSRQFGSAVTPQFKRLNARVEDLRSRQDEVGVEEEIADLIEDIEYLKVAATQSLVGSRSAQNTVKQIDEIMPEIDQARRALRAKEAELEVFRKTNPDADPETLEGMRSEIQAAKDELDSKKSFVQAVKDQIFSGAKDTKSTGAAFGLNPGKIGRPEFVPENAAKIQKLEAQIATLRSQLDKVPGGAENTRFLRGKMQRLKNEISEETSTANKRVLERDLEATAKLFNESKRTVETRARLREDLKAKEDELAEIPGPEPTISEVAALFARANDGAANLRRMNAEQGAQMTFVKNLAVTDFNEEIRKANAAGTKKDTKRAKKLTKQKEDFVKDLEFVRYRMYRETPATADPSNMAFRIGSVARDWNFLRLGGGFMISSIPDIGMHIFRHGLGQSFKTFSAAMKDPRVLGGANASFLQKIVAMGEIVGNSRAMHMQDLYEQGGNSTFERYLRGMRDGVDLPNSKGRIPSFSMLTGLTHWNAFNKSLVSLSSADTFLNMGRLLSQGKRVPAKKLRAAKELGMDEDALKRAYADWSENVTDKQTSNLLLSHTDQWGDPALAKRFEDAVISDVNNTILDVGVGDLPRMADDRLLGLIFQFRRFGIAATQSVLASGMSHRQGNMLTGMLAMVFFGGVTEHAKSGIAGREVDNDALIFNAVDRSGIMGGFADYHNMVAKVAPNMSITSALGGKEPSRYRSRNWMDALAGPLAGFFGDGFRVVNELAAGEVDEGTTNVARRMAPYQNLVWLRAGINQMKEGFDSFFDVPESATSR